MVERFTVPFLLTKMQVRLKLIIFCWRKVRIEVCCFVGFELLVPLETKTKEQII